MRPNEGVWRGPGGTGPPNRFASELPDRYLFERDRIEHGVVDRSRHVARAPDPLHNASGLAGVVEKPNLSAAASGHSANPFADYQGGPLFGLEQ